MTLQVRLERDLPEMEQAPVLLHGHTVGIIESYDKNTGMMTFTVKPEYLNQVKAAAGMVDP